MKRSDITILIVEDDKNFGRVLKEALSKTGMKVVVSTNPSDALNKCRIQTVHLAVVDCLLPKMNGIDLSLEMRQTQFDQSPIILMSGIFKEKAFENESLTKTGAVSFLHKPFEIKDLEETVNRSLEGLLESESWNLKSLLSRRLRSVRDRVKVLESLESISGLDIPMVFSILSDAKVSGHLNLVTPEAEIFGVTFSKGRIIACDSEKAESIIIKNLLNNHFLSEEDWKEFQELGEKRSVINKLINKGYVSPHAIDTAKAMQIREELASLVKFATFQVSFVPDDSIETSGGLEFADAYEVIYSEFINNIDLPFFHHLYKDYMDAPVRLTEFGSEETERWEQGELAVLPELKNLISETRSLSPIISMLDTEELTVFKAVHSLVVNRMILFDDLQKSKNAEATLERVKKLHRDLKDLNALEVFTYFGSSPKATGAEIEKIYKAFQSTNHPDLSADEAPEVRAIIAQVYELVTKAFETLTNEQARSTFFAEMKEKKETLAVEAGVLSEQGLSFLRRGQVQQALEALKKAYAITPTSKVYCMLVWAEIKINGSKESHGRLVEILQKLDGLSAEDRRDPIYWMAMGLVKRATRDPSATAHFEKALSLDAGFVEARRELNSLQVQSAQAKSSKTMDFLKGDITELVSQIFRKKSG